MQVGRGAGRIPDHASGTAPLHGYSGSMARKLDDPDLQQEFLKLIAKGKPRGKAAKAIGITSGTVREYERYNPSFADAVMDAEEDAFDPVESTVRELAKAGDISAVKEYRTIKRRREVEENRRQIIESHQTVKIEAGGRLKELIETLKERQTAEQVALERNS